MEKGKKIKFGMAPILKKLKTYFGDCEFGVFQEATGDKDGAVWAVPAEENRIDYLKAMNAQGKHVFIRPCFEQEARYMLHDDLDRNGLAKYHQDANGRWKPGRLVVESSPDNYQVWVKADRELSNAEKKHWLTLLNSDPGASPKHRWGRAPGFRNRKEKYQTSAGYPLAKLCWIDYQNAAKVPAVEIPKEVPPTKRHTSPPAKTGKFKNDGQLPTRDQYFKGFDGKGKAQESEQDLSYMMALIRHEVPEHEVKSRVMAERTNWSNHEGVRRQNAYINRTYDKAKSFIDTTPKQTVKPPRLRRSKTPRNREFNITIKCNGHEIQRKVTVGKNVTEVNEFLNEKTRLFAVKLIKQNNLERKQKDIKATIVEIKQQDSKTPEMVMER